jgi:rod shape-determining protein MreD
MKYLFLALSSFLAIIAQMVGGNNFFLFDFLDLSLILIAYWALYRSRMQALFLASISGILLDAVLGLPLGFNGFGKTCAAFVIGQVSRRFNLSGIWLRFALIVSASFLNSLCLYFLFGILQRSLNSVFLGASFIQALVTGAVGVGVFAALDSYSATQARRAG